MLFPPEHGLLFPELPMPGRSAELPPFPPLETPPFPKPTPENGDFPQELPDGEAERAYNRFEQTGSVTDYLLYKNQSAQFQGGFPFDHQDPGHRFGTDAAQFPGQKTDPAHF